MVGHHTLVLPSLVNMRLMLFVWIRSVFSDYYHNDGLIKKKSIRTRVSRKKRSSLHKHLNSDLTFEWFSDSNKIQMKERKWK